MIEAVEFVVKTGKLAEIVGGRQKVEVHCLPAHTIPAYRNNPSVNCTRGSWVVPARYVRESYLVLREDGTRSVYKTYDKALSVALKVATFKPKGS